VILGALEVLQASRKQGGIMLKKSFPFLITIILFSFVAFNLSANTTEKEVQARKAEQEGKLQEALAGYMSLLQTTPSGSATDQRLREKIIKLVKQIQPPPAIPDNALRHLGRGQAVLEIAKEPKDYSQAIVEFEKAVGLAPWLANGYYNLGMVQEKVGRLSDAIQSFKLYLMAAPSAANAREVRTRMYGLDLKLERQLAAMRAKELEGKRKVQIRRVKRSLTNDNWCLKEMYDHFSSQCYNRPAPRSGDLPSNSWVNLLASEERITIRLQWDNGGMALFDGKVKGLSLTGTQDMACCPRDYIAAFPFTGAISSDGKTITIQSNQTRLFGNFKEYVFVRVK
jgi:tetratricopeptide (TPR) repeat protein